MAAQGVIIVYMEHILEPGGALFLLVVVYILFFFLFVCVLICPSVFVLDSFFISCFLSLCCLCLSSLSLAVCLCFVSVFLLCLLLCTLLFLNVMPCLRGRLSPGYRSPLRTQMAPPFSGQAPAGTPGRGGTCCLFICGGSLCSQVAHNRQQFFF
jgi:hypothetical protein